MSRRFLRHLVTLLLIVASFAALSSKSFAETKKPFEATELHQSIAQVPIWLNVSRPPTAEELKGRIILLDFWTYCCINCMHVIPELKELEDEFKDKLTVIGVHSAKFTNEKDSENIRNAILRYDLQHPVVNDSSFLIWNAFNIHAWPTFVLINPEGKVEDQFSGEGQKSAMAKAIKGLVKKYSGRINTAKLPVSLEKDKAPMSPLSFPGKLVYVPSFEGKQTLFISDSSHHRVVGATLDGQITVSIGKKGEAGRDDGDFDSARFNKPQGLLYEDGVLYVADTGNNLVRRIDLATKKVETIAGTGKQGEPGSKNDGDALKMNLSSPWDLAFFPDKDSIAIAMAGLHQIWVYKKNEKTVSAVAGDGKENIIDGRYPDNSLAQTSGLSPQGNKLYFLDSETNSLRVLEGRKVSTLIGTGLFDFGYRTGKLGEGRLQHPIGLVTHGDDIYIADSYNHSIRRFDLKKNRLENFAGNGERGLQDGDLKSARFNEPNGIVLVEESLYVTDTNNNLIRVIDLRTQKVSTLAIFDASFDKDEVNMTDRLPNLKIDPDLTIPPKKEVAVKIKIPDGWHLNENAPSYLALYDMTVRYKPWLMRLYKNKDLQKGSFNLRPLKIGHNYRLQGTFYYCENKEGSACLLQSHDLIIRPVADATESDYVINIGVDKH